MGDFGPDLPPSRVRANTKEFPTQYAADVEALIHECRDDWLGFSAITSTAASYVRDFKVTESIKSLSLRIISDLLDAGVEAGDLTNATERGFAPWPLHKEAVLQKISDEFDHYPHGPVSGDICWFTSD